MHKITANKGVSGGATRKLGCTVQLWYHLLLALQVAPFARASTGLPRIEHAPTAAYFSVLAMLCSTLPVMRAARCMAWMLRAAGAA